MKSYINNALCEYKELKKIVNGKKTFDELCEELNGFNKCDKYFDVNYKSITTTIYNEDNKISISEYIDIWNDKECEPIVTMFNVKGEK